MSSNRIPPNSGEMRRQQAQADRIQEDQKVKEIEKTNEDARSRNKFRKLMEENIEENAKQATNSSNEPSPFETAFRKKLSTSSEEKSVEAYNSPAQPLQLDQTISNSFVPTDNSKDLPDDNLAISDPTPTNSFETSFKNKTSPRATKSEEPVESNIPQINNNHKKPLPSHSEFLPLLNASLKEGKQNELWTNSLKEKIPLSPLQSKNENSSKQIPTLTSRNLETSKFHPEFEKSEEKGILLKPIKKDTDETIISSSKEKKHPSIESPGTPSVPLDFQQVAQVAAVKAGPYIKPEIVAHYYQMVGSILYINSNKGISKTEILLNNPTFASSKFQGSKIEITRFSTAPDAFNIRLTGSPEAVNSFQAAIPGLMEAFQKGNFNFKINRIDAEHKVEKPLFKRKEKSGEKGENDFS
jgi:hypothetical protein